MKSFARILFNCLAAIFVVWGGGVQAQLAITEVMSSASTNLGPAAVTQNSDFWELTNFGTNAVNLTGYKFDDADNNLAAADPTPFDGLSIGPGESIVFVQNTVNTNESSFREWWGTNLASGVRIVFYSGNGLSSGGDGIRLWAPTAQSVSDVVDSVDFGEAHRGSSFTYSLVTGEFGVLSTNAIDGAFKAATTDDVGSPGRTPGPTPLTILQQPVDKVVNPGDATSFAVTVLGRPRGTFQWYFEDTPILGATNATLQITNVQELSAGPYRVGINNGITSTQSVSATLVLASEATPPTFTLVPADLSIYLGQSFTFAAAATGVPQPTYQWQKEGTDLDTGTSSQWTLTGVTEQDTGLYAIIAKNAVGAVTNKFQVTVTPKPQLVITEVMSSSSTNVSGHQDWWELTNLGTSPANLKGLRFDDNSETLSSAFAFTNNVTLASGESVVFVEQMTPEEFRDWWGSEHLLPGLKILTYRGNGLSSVGDAVNVWNAAASEDSDKLASAVFSTATAGVTFGYNPETGTFGELSIDGTNGAFTAASGGDVGSPGYIRNSQRVFLPRIREITISGTNIRLRWSSQVGTRYQIQFKAQLGDATWTTEKEVAAAGDVTSSEQPLNTAAGQRFYRVVASP